jgi:hypothetical protein
MVDMDEKENKDFQFIRTNLVVSPSGDDPGDTTDELIIITASADPPKQAESNSVDKTVTNSPASSKDTTDDDLLVPMSGPQKIIVALGLVGSAILVTFLVMYWVFGFRFSS